MEEHADITTCIICTEVYSDPKALPCIHTFCMKCIQETGIKTNKGPGDEMPCPICRRLFKIPTEGFHGLPKNFFIERLMQLSKASEPSADAKPLCSLCLEESTDQPGKVAPTADTYCVDCKYKLCEECCSEHRKFKATKNHKLIPINEFESGQNVMTHQTAIVCEVHEQKVLDIYCADCKTVVCAFCFIEDHNNHKGCQVNKCFDDFRNQIQNSTEAINGCIAKAQMKKTELLKVKNEMQERLERLECDVVKRKYEIQQLADTNACSLLQTLSSEQQSRLKEIKMSMDDIDACVSNLESYNSYCQRIVTEGLASDVCRAFSDLSIRALELQEECKPIVEKGIQQFNFCFTQSELEELLGEDCGNLVGKIEVPVELRYNSDPVLVKTIRTKAKGEEKKLICGLTILGKELFVVTRKSSEVEVYHSINLSLSRTLKLTELINPKDIGSCDRNKSLFIFHYNDFSQSSEILRVDPNGNLIRKWPTGSDSVCKLSVTYETNVIIAFRHRNKLSEYSADGKLIREINLLPDSGIRFPSHAMKVTNGNLLVSHSSDSGLHRVCIMDADGKLKKSFGGKLGSTIEELNCPNHLSVYSNGFVLVADRDNNRVLLLDSDLNLKREILSNEKHGLQDPTRILLDESNGRLFVAGKERKNGRILIFDFK